MDVAGVAVLATNDLVRSGIQAVLQQSDQAIQVSGTFVSVSDCEQGLMQIKDQVKILILDDSISKPIPAICRLLQRYPLLKIVIISDFLNELYIENLMKSGIKGFLYSRDHLGSALVTCICVVADGHIYLSPRASALTYNRDVIGEFNLTDMAVLQLMDSGYKSREIADRLHLVPQCLSYST